MSRQTLYRTIVRVINVVYVDGVELAEVIVSSWNHRKTLRIPTLIIPPDLLRNVRVSMLQNKKHWLIAKVNTGEDENANELHFEQFEDAPELDENDGLG